MMKRMMIATAVCLLLFVGAKPPVTEAQSASEIMQQVNQFRINNGLPPLSYNSALASAAQNQANYMVQYQVFSSHVGFNGSTPQSRANAAGYNGRVNENIVGGTGLTAPKGLTWWVNSPVHYNTLITTQYTEAGTAFATDGEINYFVLVVGQPSNAPIQPPIVTTNPEPLFIIPITLAKPGEDGSLVHVVQDGQALWSLAAHYDVPLSDLLLFNGLLADSFVQPGDEIIIRLPEGVPPPPTPTPPTTHFVREGESLWSIAVTYDVKIGDVMWFNNLTENSFLQPGQEIKVRLAPGEAPPPTPTPITTHLVQSGQTLWEIALTYNLSLDELLAFNNMDENSLILVRDVLLIRPPNTPTPTPLPTSTATATAVTTPTNNANIPPTPLLPPQNPTAESIAANVLPGTAVPTPRPNTVQQFRSLQPFVFGSLLFVVGLLALGGAFLVALRREKL
ncbi:MAG: LysM peptidoglycan-binding domain-containing protein [Chloroflexi bacterium]|nr:LysM peptidoglycan-binding domain-containing protein [Chloroflexota bacterium]